MSSVAETKISIWQSDQLSRSEEAVAYLNKHLEQDCSKLFFSFLETFALDQGRRDGIDSHDYTFVVLDGSLTAASDRVRQIVMSKIISAHFRNKRAHFGNSECMIKGRIYELKDADLADTASILEYQKGRIDPTTFAPLDFYKNLKINQKFISAQVFHKIGDAYVPLAEYFCPCRMDETEESTLKQFSKLAPPVQVRLSSKQFVQRSLDHIAAIFARIIKPAKAYTKETLQTDLAELTYKWTLLSPLENGMELSTEFIQSTLANLHGFRVSKANHSLLTFGSPYYPNFLAKYKKAVILT